MNNLETDIGYHSIVEVFYAHTSHSYYRNIARKNIDELKGGSYSIVNVGLNVLQTWDALIPGSIEVCV